VKPKPKQKPNKSRAAAKSRPVAKVKTITRRKPMISDKDKDHDKHEADKRAAEKAAAEKDKPVHAPFSTAPLNTPVAPADMMTAQESDQSAEVPGVGPVSPSEVSPGPVETIEEQGIGPRTPYPTGSPPPPSETIIMGQGIKGATDKPVLKPGEVKPPVNRPAPTQQPHRDPPR
jgi:hypothetical protein